MSANRLLVIDDEPDVAAFVAEVAGDLGFEAQALSDPRQFQTQLGLFGSAGICFSIGCLARTSLGLHDLAQGRSTAVPPAALPVAPPGTPPGQRPG